MVKKPVTLLLLSLSLFSSGAWPQTQLATVFGTVTDPSGAVISGAQVTILSQGTGLKRDTPNGKVESLAVQPAAKARASTLCARLAGRVRFSSPTSSNSERANGSNLNDARQIRS